MPSAENTPSLILPQKKYEIFRSAESPAAFFIISSALRSDAGIVMSDFIESPHFVF